MNTTTTEDIKKDLPAPNRTGMIAFNRAGQILLVRALNKTDPADPSPPWVLPKGHIEPGEESDRWKTAERECQEETGVIALVDSPEPIGYTTFQSGDEAVCVEWWTGIAIRREESIEGRGILWVYVDQALKLIPFSNLQEIIRRACCWEEGVEECLDES